MREVRGSFLLQAQYQSVGVFEPKGDKRKGAGKQGGPFSRCSILFGSAVALVARVHQEKSLRSRRPLTRSSASSAVRWGISARIALIRSRQLLLTWMVD